MENNFRPSSPDSSRYWLLLKDLNDSVKIELIALLSNSVAHKATDNKNDENWATSFSGAWKDNRTAEEILADIQENRTSNSRDVVL